MTKKEFDESKFFSGMKAKYKGEWHLILTADFDDRTISIMNGRKIKEIEHHFIDEFEKTP